MNNKLYDFLLNKSRPELQIIAKKLKILNYYRLSKKKLITEILKHNNKKILKNKIIGKKGFSIIKLLYYLIPIIIGFFIALFFYLKSSDDVQNIIDARFTEYEKKILKENEYIEHILMLEKNYYTILNKKFSGGYQVYGLRNQHLVQPINVNDKYILNKFNSYVKFHKEYKTATVAIIINELNITSEKFSIQESIFEEEIYIKNILELVPLTVLNIYDYNYYFIMLNNDLNNPVFAIGLTKNDK